MTKQQGMNRRNFVLAATATASTMAVSMKRATAEPRNYGPGAPPVRYPDPNIVVLDDSFKSYKLGNAAIMRLYHSKRMIWAEGPAWNGVG
ncbi:MAG TPA: gluconolactonase, partial [Planctomycetaceae bacterium]|nr:gluconolactonase [Planctomycetaceae bacterium]